MTRSMPLRFILVALLLVLAAGLAQAMKPERKARMGAEFNLEAMIPQRFGDWQIDPSVVPIKASPDVQANLSRIYDQILARTYINSKGERMMLTVAYGGEQTDTLKAHRQEVCYGAQGFEILRLVHGVLDVGRSSIPVTTV